MAVPLGAALRALLPPPLSPQCGFASVAAGNEISWDDQRRKLELLVETARKVWPR